jgi:hypothetical protein
MTGRRIIFGFVIVAALIAIAAEGWHRFHFGHFVGYGLHTDIVLVSSAVGKNDTYVARVWNLSAKTIEVEGCKLPGGYAGSGVLYHWDVQRWDPSRHEWSSLNDANNWIPQPLGSFDLGSAWSRCGGEVTRIRPLAARELAWVFRDWVAKDDAIRMAIHTSVKMPLDRQQIIYTQTFSVQ